MWVNRWQGYKTSIETYAVIHHVIAIVIGLAAATAMHPAAITADDLSQSTGRGLRVGQLRVNKVLFLGNSITLHGPAPKIGWEGNWGMAASARDKDYVHLLLARIAKAAGGQPESKIKNIADFERGLDGFNLKDGLKEELAFEANVVIVALGENAAALGTDEAKMKFKTAFANLLNELKQHDEPAIFVRSTFWAEPAKDEIMKQVCEEAGGVFVDNSKLGGDATSQARSERKIEHDGVAAHPGDKGMKAISDALWAAIEKESMKRMK